MWLKYAGSPVLHTLWSYVLGGAWRCFLTTVGALPVILIIMIGKLAGFIQLTPKVQRRVYHIEGDSLSLQDS